METLTGRKPIAECRQRILTSAGSPITRFAVQSKRTSLPSLSSRTPTLEEEGSAFFCDSKKADSSREKQALRNDSVKGECSVGEGVRGRQSLLHSITRFLRPEPVLAERRSPIADREFLLQPMARS